MAEDFGQASEAPRDRDGPEEEQAGPYRQARGEVRVAGLDANPAQEGQPRVGRGLPPPGQPGGMNEGRSEESGEAEKGDPEERPEHRSEETGPGRLEDKALAFLAAVEAGDLDRPVGVFCPPPPTQSNGLRHLRLSPHLQACAECHAAEGHEREQHHAPGKRRAGGVAAEALQGVVARPAGQVPDGRLDRRGGELEADRRTDAQSLRHLLGRSVKRVLDGLPRWEGEPVVDAHGVAYVSGPELPVQAEYLGRGCAPVRAELCGDPLVAPQEDAQKQGNGREGDAEPDQPKRGLPDRGLGVRVVDFVHRTSPSRRVRFRGCPRERAPWGKRRARAKTGTGWAERGVGTAERRRDILTRL